MDRYRGTGHAPLCLPNGGSVLYNGGFILHRMDFDYEV